MFNKCLLGIPGGPVVRAWCFHCWDGGGGGVASV